MSSPTSQNRTSRRRWLSWTLAGIAGAAVLAVALWLCVAVLPQRLYPSLSTADLAGLSPADRAARREGRAKLQNDARTTLLQALAAMLVLSGAGIGAAVTLRQVRIGRDQVEQARKQAQLSDDRAREQLELAREQAQRSDKRLREQIAIAQEGQITERFTRAVDQLGQPGPDRLDVRLGGIYALERIAHDSPTHRLVVFEILTAFIRSHAPWPPRLPGQYHADAPIDQVPSLQTRASDVQAALTVIGRRPTQKGDPRLDLSQTDLRKAELPLANLAEARFDGANLTRARLLGATLDRAEISRAILTEAKFSGASLTRARFSNATMTKGEIASADLTEARLSQADLTEAQFAGSNLTRAELIEANLTRAYLHEANLTGADLRRANLTEATLSEARLTRAQLDGANLTRVQLDWANMTRTRLDGADLTQAHLDKARANHETVWPDGWDRTRRAGAGVDEPDEEASPAPSPPG